MSLRTYALTGLLFSPFFQSSLAHALDFVEYGVVNLSLPSIQYTNDPSLSASGGLAFGGGISLGVSVWKEYYLETGIGYVTRNFNETSSAIPQNSLSLASFQIPLVIRYWFTPEFSLGAGGYFSHGTGNVTSTQGGSSSPVSYNNLGLARNELGAILSGRTRTPLNEVMSFVVDARILWGLSNKDISGNGTVMFRDLQVWAGIGFIL